MKKLLTLLFAAALTFSMTAIAQTSGGDTGKDKETKKEEKKEEDDPWVDVTKEKWTYKIGGRVMIDYVNFANQNALSQTVAGDAQDYFDFRRMYLSVETSPFMRIWPSPRRIISTARAVALPSSGSCATASLAGSIPDSRHAAAIVSRSPTSVPSTMPSSTARLMNGRLCSSSSTHGRQEGLP